MKKFLTATILAAFITVGLTASANAGHDKGHYDARSSTSKQGSIGSWHIKDDSVKMRDLKPLTEKRVRHGQQAWKQIRRNKADWSKDEVGVTGTETGKPAAEVVRDIAPGEKGTATAHCPDGKVALSGGYEVERAGAEISVLRNQPQGEYDDGMFTAWEVQILNTGTVPVDLAPAVVCATR